MPVTDFSLVGSNVIQVTETGSQPEYFPRAPYWTPTADGLKIGFVFEMPHPRQERIYNVLLTDIRVSGAGSAPASIAAAATALSSVFPKAGSSTASPTAKYTYSTHFAAPPIATGSNQNPRDISGFVSGGGASWTMGVPDATYRPGVLLGSTGTTNAGLATMGLLTGNGGQIILGGGQWSMETSINIPVLSTSAERFSLEIGFITSITTASQTDEISILYDEGGTRTGSAASANWQLVTASSSTRTFVTSSSAVAAATWYKLKVIVNAAGTNADFYVNGTLIGSITTNIPIGARRVGIGYVFVKTVGTTARTVNVDWLEVDGNFTTP